MRRNPDVFISIYCHHEILMRSYASGDNGGLEPSVRSARLCGASSLHRIMNERNAIVFVFATGTDEHSKSFSSLLSWRGVAQTPRARTHTDHTALNFTVYLSFRTYIFYMTLITFLLLFLVYLFRFCQIAQPRRTDAKLLRLRRTK